MGLSKKKYKCLCFLWASVCKSFSLRVPRLVCLLILVGFTWGCIGKPAVQTEPNQEGQVYRPPTLFAQTPLVLLPSPTNLETDSALLPTATPACSNGLRFVEDLTIPDGTQVAPGQIIDKRWRVENVGDCNWNEFYRLRLVAGPDLGSPSEQALYPARSGTQAMIRAFFVAPAEPGVYRSAWQAYDPQGRPFGDTVFIQIIVSGP